MRGALIERGVDHVLDGGDADPAEDLRSQAEESRDAAGRGLECVAIRQAEEDERAAQRSWALRSWLRSRPC